MGKLEGDNQRMKGQLEKMEIEKGEEFDKKCMEWEKKEKQLNDEI